MNEPKLYDENGFFNFEWVASKGATFNFILGGRRTGKTYGYFKYVTEHALLHMYMRRTDAIVKEMLADDMNPAKSYIRDHDLDLMSAPIAHSKYLKGWFHGEPKDDGTLVPKGPAVGYACGLSVFGQLRGFSGDGIKVACVDEFIPKDGETRVNGESRMFLDFYDTVNSNRQLRGEKPLQVFFLSNSNRLANEYFLEYSLINVVDDMIQKGQTFRFNNGRHFTISLLSDSPIAEKRSHTDLYEFLGKDHEYSKMALGNEFTGEHRSFASPRPLREYYPLVSYGPLCVYAPKNESEKYYCCLHIAGEPQSRLDPDDVGKQKLRAGYSYLWQEYLLDNILFDGYMAEATFKQAWGNV